MSWHVLVGMLPSRPHLLTLVCTHGTQKCCKDFCNSSALAYQRVTLQGCLTTAFLELASASGSRWVGHVVGQCRHTLGVSLCFWSLHLVLFCFSISAVHTKVFRILIFFKNNTHVVLFFSTTHPLWMLQGPGGRMAEGAPQALEPHKIRGTDRILSWSTGDIRTP